MHAALFVLEQESSSVVGFDNQFEGGLLAVLHVLLLTSKLIDEPQTIWRKSGALTLSPSFLLNTSKMLTSSSCFSSVDEEHLDCSLL